MTCTTILREMHDILIYRRLSLWNSTVPPIFNFRKMEVGILGSSLSLWVRLNGIWTVRWHRHTLVQRWKNAKIFISGTPLFPISSTWPKWNAVICLFWWLSWRHNLSIAYKPILSLWEWAELQLTPEHRTLSLNYFEKIRRYCMSKCAVFHILPCSNYMQNLNKLWEWHVATPSSLVNKSRMVMVVSCCILLILNRSQRLIFF